MGEWGEWELTDGVRFTTLRECKFYDDELWKNKSICHFEIELILSIFLKKSRIQQKNLIYNLFKSIRESYMLTANFECPIPGCPYTEESVEYPDEPWCDECDDGLTEFFTIEELYEMVDEIVSFINDEYVHERENMFLNPTNNDKFKLYCVLSYLKTTKEEAFVIGF